MEKTKSSGIALSGITPSSSKGLHLGNYFGAVKPHVEFQEEYNCNYFVANLHALNSVYDPKEVEENTMNVFLEYLAFGIDPEKTTFYVQSDVHAIPYLQTIFNNVLTVSELKRMHGYKDKLQKGVEQDAIGFGLFSYPVLMAADILAFKPDVVPVGEDQTQHVEITRDIAKKLNKRYNNVLKIPKLFVKKDVARVKGIDGERKMGKSFGNDIPIFGTEEEIRKQIMKITTDPNRIHADDQGDPEKNIAFEYLRLLDFDNEKLQEMREKYKTGSIKDVEIKEELFDKFMDYFAEFRKKKVELSQNMDYVYELRDKGAAKANLVADKTLEKVKNAVGVSSRRAVASDDGKKPNIDFDDFMKLDIRIGTIESVEKHPDANKLLVMKVNLGEETRQILAGVAEFYKPEDLVGKQVPFIVNLEPRMIRGLESQGMMMAADPGTKDDPSIALLHPSVELPNGSLVR